VTGLPSSEPDLASSLNECVAFVLVTAMHTPPKSICLAKLISSRHTGSCAARSSRANHSASTASRCCLPSGQDSGPAAILAALDVRLRDGQPSRRHYPGMTVVGSWYDHQVGCEPAGRAG
jgi:hypothetical protein